MKVDDILLLKSDNSLAVYRCKEIIYDDFYIRTIYSFDRVHAVKNAPFASSSWYRDKFSTDKLDQVISEGNGEIFTSLEECIAAYPEEFI